VAKPPTPDPRPRVIDHQNRVALPPEVLRALGVTTGDYVAFEVSGDDVRLQRVRWVVDRG
jgi:bifunctional DNA-binding transcriptional regulator/antitoxin component of YhaV-PrlF toxin-antitoxin module